MESLRDLEPQKECKGILTHLFYIFEHLLCACILLALGKPGPVASMELTAYTNSNHIFYRFVHEFKQIFSSLRSKLRWISDFSTHQNHLEGLLKPRLLGSIPRISDSIDQGWSLYMSISDKLQGYAEAAVHRHPILRTALTMCPHWDSGITKCKKKRKLSLPPELLTAQWV